jgi:hypothetical protein
MSAFQNIVKTAVEQLNAFYAAQLELAHKSLDNYDEHVETASNIKKSEMIECCNDTLEDLKYQLNEIQNDFNVKVNHRIEETRKHLKEKQNSFNVEDGNAAGQFHADVQALIGETQNTMLARVANLHNELDLDDDFLNGYGKFKANEKPEEVAEEKPEEAVEEKHEHEHMNEGKCNCDDCTDCEDCDCENCDCENCDCENCDCDEVVEEPAAEPVVEEPAAEPVVEEPAAEPVVEPAAEPVVEEPAAEPVVEEPAAEPVVEEPAAETNDFLN